MIHDLYAIWALPYANGNIVSEIKKRDQLSGDLDLLLSSAGWELWNDFQVSVPSTSSRLRDFWKNAVGPRAVLILDGMSLRELLIFAREAPKNGLSIQDIQLTRSELPADTTSFSRALGLPQRSSLENNGRPSTFALADAHTETTNLPWEDCKGRLGSHPNCFFWHHWPDSKLHEFSNANYGVDALVEQVSNQMSSVDFWDFVKELAHGRQLIITSDHGYAASGLFGDSTTEQSNYLKDVLKSQRFAPTNNGSIGRFCPPVDRVLDTPYGKTRFALGRRKWKSPGGYPTLVHGGLSLLEVLVPYIEIGGVY
jgi:hypothetical protein